MPVGVSLICSLLAAIACGAIPFLPPAGATTKNLLSLVWKESIKAVLVLGPGNFLQRAVLRSLVARLVSLLLENSPLESWEYPRPVNLSQAALISHSSGST